MARHVFNDSAEIVDLAEYRRAKETDLADYKRRYQEFEERLFWLVMYEYKPIELAKAQAWTECFART